ncbi:cupin domain-containing protein [Yersinia pseudotuberculosis]|nr:cupin domain-containing protein [Yersinia pseudotuberculosis]
MKVFLITLAALLLPGTQALAAAQAAVTVSPAVHNLRLLVHRNLLPVQQKLTHGFKAPPQPEFPGGTVSFEAGARTAWHTHPLGQTLIVSSGTGWVQEWEGAAQQIKTGDVVWIPPGVKHWHGASAKESMVHIAVSESLDGNTVTWMEKKRPQHCHSLNMNGV